MIVDRTVHRLVANTFRLIFSLRRSQARAAEWLARSRGSMTAEEADALRCRLEQLEGRCARLEAELEEARRS